MLQGRITLFSRAKKRALPHNLQNGLKKETCQEGVGKKRLPITYGSFNG